jgi:(p)ppGpp synthase/HD superfamily hydrolase
MPTLRDAIGLARQVHHGQRDKAGKPYIEHVLRVVAFLDATDDKIVGALHDVLEESSYTSESLRRLGYPERIVNAVECLTKQSGEDYDHYISRVKQDEIARRVKIADLKDNMDMARIPAPSVIDWERLAKYRRALQQLTISP